jgi:large subunit ribosomal protein L2
MYIISKKKSFKYLLNKKLKINGRINTGKIVIYHRGGGVKRNYRLIDYSKYIWNLYGLIYRIEYDPNRNCLLSFILYTNGIFCYSLNIQNLKIGDRILNKINFLNKIGYSCILKNIPVNLKINSIELKYLKGAQYIRSAGLYCTIYKHLKNFIILKFKNKRFLKLQNLNIATIGIISFFEYIFLTFKKAGYFRNKGWRPIVRGVAKNPIDHPHGGGQGKTSGGRPSVTPKGKITKGYKTVKYKNYIIKK